MPHRPSPASLEAVLDDAWARLEGGLTRRHDPFHQGVLATIGLDGAPSARYVVVREVDRAAGMVGFHTDARSAKPAELARAPRVSLCLFGESVQLRLSGEARVLREGPVVDAAWARTGMLARRCYLAEPAPGTDADMPLSGLPEAWVERPPGPAESEAGRVNFALVEITLDGVEWLHLAHAGHRRARFRRAGDGWTGRWCVP